MNALCVLNLNNFMPLKVRRSFRHAAVRWHCEFVEVTTPLGPWHPFWQKASIPTSPYVRNFDRILQLDCDMLIRNDCPNIFDLVPEDNIGVVSRIQPGSGQPPRMEWKMAPGARAMGLTPYPKIEHHLNAGLILYSPVRHRALLEAWKAAGSRCHWAIVAGVPEQLALSCLLQSMDVPTTWLPWQYNTLRAGRKAIAPPGAMKTYVYHFNGPRGRNLQKEVERCLWRVVPLS